MNEIVTGNFNHEKVVLISMTNRMGGAEQMLLMIADTIRSPLLFLKKVKAHGLPLKEDQQVRYLTDKPLFVGFLLLIRELFKYRKDYVIISSHAYLNAFLGILKRIGYLKSKVIVRESTSLFSRFKGFKKWSYKLGYRIGYPAVELAICQTQLMRDELLSHNRYIPGSKVIVLDNAISLKSVKSKAEEVPADSLLQSEFICAAGRLIAIKGFDVLIKAFKALVPDNPKLKLLILGEGPERERLSKLINKLGLKGKVFLPGHADNPFPYFKKARVCVVSSLQEGFPNVLLQMMALNTNVVSTLCAGGVEDMPYVEKVAPKNEADLISGIKRALSNRNANIERENIDFYLQSRSPEAYINRIFAK